ncbi:MAG: hypothetical protein AAF198_08985 [Pseudomonadota bacterium]
MSQERSGSRYLYEPFKVTQERIDANERVQEERWIALERRLGDIENALVRLDRRLWLAAAAVVTVILTEAVMAVLAAHAP